MIDNPFINKEPIKVGRALISVFDKNGIVELAQELIKLNIEIISTGGTAETLRKAKVSVIDVGDYTNFPEIMDGRVKTINPLVEGGILGLRDQHEKDANSNNIKWGVYFWKYPYSILPMDIMGKMEHQKKGLNKKFK